MAISGQVTTYNQTNYVGELFNITPTETVFLSSIGGLNGARGIRATEFGFQTEDLPAASQPAHLEGQDAPTATAQTRTAVTNVTQIFHESVEVSYSKQASIHQIASGFLGVQPVTDEFQHQLNLKITKTARDLNYTFLRGTYAKPADNSSARKTRGMLSAVSTNAIAASGAALSKTMLQQLWRSMADNGALFRDMVMYLPSLQKQRVTDIYAYAPTDRNIGGVNIKQIETDFGMIGVVFERHMPNDSILVAEMTVLQPVFTEIPDQAGGFKGVFFYEELAKVGAAERGQLYGEIGLDHGPELYHGKITGLATS